MHTHPLAHRATLLLVMTCMVLAAPGAAPAAVARTALVATGADDDAGGNATLRVKRRKGSLEGLLVVTARRLEPGAAFELTLDGVRVGTLESSRRGKARARLRTTPRRASEHLLGVDPRGRRLAVVRTGAVVLAGTLPAAPRDAGDVRCCLPDDSGTECEDRTAAECAAAGGVDLGPGSCLPNPCGGTTPGSDVVCCPPDDSGPECEDRTAAQCAGEGGIRVDATSCASAPCAPMAPPDGDVRCCLPDDSGPKCEDRTAAECAAAGGVNIGAGACAPNPCLGGGVTTTTLPAAPTLRVTCEKRADRSRVSVDAQNVAGGTYRARVTSGASAATSDPRPTVGDEVEFDFDSDPGDVAAGATPIAAGFLAGTPPAATGELLGAGDAVVATATATCALR